MFATMQSARALPFARWVSGEHEKYPVPCNQAKMWSLGKDFLCLVTPSSSGPVE